MLLLPPSKALKMPRGLLDDTNLRQETKWLEIRQPTDSPFGPNRLDSVRVTWAEHLGPESRSITQPWPARMCLRINPRLAMDLSGVMALKEAGTTSPREIRYSTTKEEKDQTQTQTPHMVQDTTRAVWKQFADGNLSVMNQFPWTLRG